MPHPRHFRPVYPNKDHTRPDLWRKAGSYVSVADWGLINSLAGSSGIVSHIIDQAIHDTAEHIRRNNLRFPDDTERFLQWLRERKFTEQERASSGVVPEQPVIVKSNDDIESKSVPTLPSEERSRALSDRRKRLVAAQRTRTQDRQ